MTNYRVTSVGELRRLTNVLKDFGATFEDDHNITTRTYFLCVSLPSVPAFNGPGVMIIELLQGDVDEDGFDFVEFAKSLESINCAPADGQSR